MPSEWSNDELSSEEDRDPTSELRELEDELCRLGGVHAVRVVGDRSGRPIEVHVLADPSKPAKQTVRDVRAVAQTMFGIELDHRIVSVAQLEHERRRTRRSASSSPRANPGHASAASTSRPSGVRAQVRVVLVDERPRAHRLRRGLGRERRLDRSSSPRPHSTPSARRSPRPRRSTSPSAEISRIGTNRVAVVTVVYVEPPTELVVSGSAVVRRDRDDAVARALLDATNRRLARAERGRASR